MGGGGKKNLIYSKEEVCYTDGLSGMDKKGGCHSSGKESADAGTTHSMRTKTGGTSVIRISDRTGECFRQLYNRRKKLGVRKEM